MAFGKLTLLFTSFLLLVSNIGNIDAQSCGGNYTTNYGVFMSPNYPDVYPLDVECIYRITPSTMSSITLNFETFELDRSTGDYVSITCESDTRNLPKSFSWNVNIAPISMPSCSIAQLYFHSDSHRNYSTRGFRVQYQVSTEGCGYTVFTSPSGTISSPNYPQNYSNNENSLQLEPDCQHDWVQIRCDNSSYILPKYCGSTLPKPAYISDCNKVLIWFHTNSAAVYSGFRLQFSFTSYGCGKSIYTALSGVITSPNYPKGYNGMSCPYYLYPVSSVSLAFQSFDLEPFIDNSKGDYVWIDCESNGSYSGVYYRGNSLPPLISYTFCSCVYILFFSNYALSGTGFSFKYQVNSFVAHSAIINAPKNLTVDFGSSADLDCTSNATDYYPSWTLSRDGTDENTEVIASFCVVNSGYTPDYSVVKGGAGACRLVITYATLTEAGIYTCIDVGLASSSSVVTVVDPNAMSPSSGQGQTDSDVIIIVLAVLLTISALGYIGIAIFFTVRRCKETSKEEGQRKPNQEMRPGNDSVKTRATGSVYEDLPDRVLSTESSTMTTRNDACGYEHLNHGLDNPAAYDTLKRQ